MSTHYHIDANTNPIASSEINDVIQNPGSEESDAIGNFVVALQDALFLDQDPTDFNNLITQKYAALLDFYAGFANVDFDNLEDATGLDASNSTGVILGGRGSTAIEPDDLAANGPGLLQSVVVNLAAMPAEAVITWEVNTYVTTNPSGGRLTRRYKGGTPDALDVTVSFDNGGNFATVTDGSLLNVANTGNQFIIRFTNNTAGRLFLGSWAVIY